MAFDKKGKAATKLAYQEDIKDHVWVWNWFKSGWGKPEVNKRKEYVIHTGRFHTGAVNRSAYSQEITFTFDNIADRDKKVRSVTERDINRIDRNMSLGDRFATGLQNVGDESGRGVGLGALRAKTTRSGSGPRKGVIEVSHRYASSKQLQNYKGPAVEFVFDTERGIFAYGRPKDGVGSPHQKLVNSIGSEQGEHIVGGIMLRKPDGSFQFNEHSGHFGINWDDQKRAQFSSFMQKEAGIKVDNVGYNGKD